LKKISNSKYSDRLKACSYERYIIGGSFRGDVIETYTILSV